MLIYALQNFTATDGTVCTAKSTYTVSDEVGRIAIQRGQAQQSDSPDVLYGQPANLTPTRSGFPDPTTGNTVLTAWRQKLTAIRPKLASFGNSINARSQLGNSQANNYDAWGHIYWIHALTNAAFDRARSQPYSWGAQGNASGAETIDAYGAYAWGGATNSAAGTYNFLNHLPQALQKFIDTPDIVYLSNLFENDLAQGIAAATIINDGLKTINLVKTKWPNALIIIATPNPSTSYNTSSIHSAVATVTAWIQSLPASDPHILVENNTSTILNGTADQPRPDYTSDNVIHPNERGALVRAKAFVSQFGALFPNALQIPAVPYNSGAPGSTFQPNPDFSLLGAPGAAISGNTYTSYDWYKDTNYAATVTKNALGAGVTITMSATGTVTAGSGVSATSDAVTSTVDNGGVYFSASRVTILNPTNLATIYNLVNFSGGVAESHTGPFYQGTFLSSYPLGLSDIFQSGDTLTLTTAPLPPGSTNTVCSYTQTKMGGCAALNASTPASQQPSVQISVQNLIQVANNGAQALTIASAAAYSNKSKGLQQIVISGGTASALALTRGAVATALPAATNTIVILAPGDSLTPTYTVAPTFTLLQLD